MTTPRRAHRARPRSRSLYGGVLFAALAFAAPSCVPKTVTIGETHMGRAEVYQTGNARYDDFFRAAHDIQGKAVGILDDDQKARAPLADALDQADEPLDQLVKPAKARAKKYSKGGPGVRLETAGLDDAGKPVAGQKVSVTVAGVSYEDRDAMKFGAALRQTSESSAKMLGDYADLPDEARKLAATADDLRAALPDAFPGAWNRRDEISNELGAAKLILLAAADRTDKVIASVEVFFRDMGEHASAVAAAPPPAPAAPEKPVAKAKKGGKGGAGAAAPKKMPVSSGEAPPPKPAPAPKHETESAPAPAPKPPKPAGDDFNP